MSGGFKNYLTTKLGQLVVTAIQSPGYAAGASGWSINKDGSAEFNNGTFRGTVTGGVFEGADFVINQSGAFFYSGAPAAGNLLASVATAAGTDEYGNAYLDGYNVYDGNAHIQVHVNDTVGAPAVELVTGVPFEYAHAALYSFAPGSGADQNITTWLAGPAASSDKTPAGITLQSNNEGGTSYPSVDFVIGTAVTGQVTSTGLAHEPVPGVFAPVPCELVQAGTLTADTGTPAPITQVTAIPADMPAGYSYRVRAFGTGVQGSTQGVVSFEVVAFGTTIASVAVDASVIAASAAFDFEVEAEVTVYSTGTSGIAFGKISGTMQQAGVHAKDTTSTAFTAVGNDVTVNTTAAGSIYIAAAVGEGTAGQLLRSYQNVFAATR